jgi:hypothetical protein
LGGIRWKDVFKRANGASGDFATHRVGETVPLFVGSCVKPSRPRLFIR